MNNILQRVYAACGAAAGFFLVAIAALIAGQIAARIAGYQLPDADEIAAYSMAASTFLALPYAFVKGDHIRVTLFTSMLPPTLQKGAELIATVAGLILSLFCAWHFTSFVAESFMLKEVSPGLLAIPMWIPQLGMAVGACVLALAVLERTIDLLRGTAAAEESDIRMSE